MGFISELPTELVAAFRATLEEVAEADVILHVRDAAHPDSAAQRTDVMAVLDGMVEDGTLDADWPSRTIEVLNKADLLGGVGTGRGRGPAPSPVSAITGEGLPALRDGDRRPHRGRRWRWPITRSRPRRARGWRGSTSMARSLRVATRTTAIHVTVRLLPADRARFERDTE